MTTQTIERIKEICHQCENWKLYKELATFKYDGGRTVWFSPFTCLNCHNKKNFIKWKKIINNKQKEVMVYACHCPKCK